MNEIEKDRRHLKAMLVNYVNTFFCRWTITVAEGKRIRITFNHLNIESEEGLPCYFYDFLKVNKGQNSVAGCLNLLSRTKNKRENKM